MLLLANFIAPTVIQFLSVRSLVWFGNTCSLHSAVVLREVQRRGDAIAAIKAKVARLVALTGSNETTCKNIAMAMELAGQGRRLIDNDVKFHNKICTNELRCNDGGGHQPVGEDGYDWRDFDLFFKERMKFLPGDYPQESGSLYIMPLCFYLPPEGKSQNPSSTEAVNEAYEMTIHVRHAEDVMGSNYLYDFSMCKDNWEQLNYKEPLSKFTLPGAGLFTGFVEGMVCNLTGHRKIDSFRIAVRTVYFKRHLSRDCLWYTLHRADKLEALIKSKEDTNLEEDPD